MASEAESVRGFRISHKHIGNLVADELFSARTQLSGGAGAPDPLPSAPDPLALRLPCRGLRGRDGTLRRLHVPGGIRSGRQGKGEGCIRERVGVEALLLISGLPVLGRRAGRHAAGIRQRRRAAAASRGGRRGCAAVGGRRAGGRRGYGVVGPGGARGSGRHSACR